MDLVDITDESGNAASPVLPEHVKNYLIDIDRTVGEDIPNEEPERMTTADAYPDAIETINRWYDEGHQICFFTARTEDHRAVTEMWLEEKGGYESTLRLSGRFRVLARHCILVGVTPRYAP